MNNYPNPCDTCTECDGYRKCDRWKMRFLTIWKQFNSYRKRKMKKGEKVETFVYEHPDLLRKYVQEGPCKWCKVENTCDTPCSAYYAWWDARMAVAKHKCGMEK